MFKKILIANRGEIACRVAATARRLGVRTVAVYSDADANARHVRPATRRCTSAATRRATATCAASASSSRARHRRAGHPPGLRLPVSENEGFAQACADAGLVFIGPPPSAIAAMGSKAEPSADGAAGVPLVPGYHGDDQDPALLKREAARIGYPVLIKASAGGGGKGMRIVARPRVRRRAGLLPARGAQGNSFGDDAVLVERYVQRPRHIEIQVFGDSHGECVYLFERDCSVQRRHQKVLEEAPAPGMSAERRGARWARPRWRGQGGGLRRRRHGGVHRREVDDGRASTSWR
jgi:3-methylcrotonyl-CoA carboxylase alpha subunit